MKNKRQKERLGKEEEGVDGGQRERSIERRKFSRERKVGGRK